VARREGDIGTDARHTRYVAEHIPGARLVELPGRDNLIFVGDMEPPLRALEEFLMGARPPQDADRILATVLFTDIVGSTERATELGDRRWREVLASHNDVVQRELGRVRGTLVKTTGDGLLATFDGPARAVRCAVSLGEALRSHGIEIRAGAHTGEIEVLGEDVGGIAVHIAARVAATASSEEVLVSSTVKDLVCGSGIEFEDRGRHALKGVTDEWRLYAVTKT
jgi:class 3 adenylate cyclase